MLRWGGKLLGRNAIRNTGIGSPLHRCVWTLGLPQSPEIMEVQSMDDHGFTISGANLRGPVIVFPEFALLWNVECWDKVTIESFIPIWCLKPHVDLVLIGTGETFRPLHPAIPYKLRSYRITCEFMKTEHALSTFNVLANEGRRVAAALLPPQPVPREDTCLYTDERPVPRPDGVYFFPNEANRRQV